MCEQMLSIVEPFRINEDEVLLAHLKMCSPRPLLKLEVVVFRTFNVLINSETELRTVFYERTDKHRSPPLEQRTRPRYRTDAILSQ